MNDSDTQRRVIENYFQTTSAVSLATGSDQFDVSTWHRRLGKWMDVAKKDVLDLGCGMGTVCLLCEKSGAAKITGVNLSDGELELARQHVHATFVCADIEAYLDTCQPASVDRIFALNILEHLDKDKLVRVLEGAFRALRYGGTLVAMVPNATSPFGTMTRYWDITHYNAFTLSSLTQLSRLCGFGDAIEFRECGPVPHGFISTVRFGLWQGIRLCIKAYLLIELASAKGGIYTADLLVRLRKPECATE